MLCSIIPGIDLQILPHGRFPQIFRQLLGRYVLVKYLFFRIGCRLVIGFLALNDNPAVRDLPTRRFADNFSFCSSMYSPALVSGQRIRCVS